MAIASRLAELALDTRAADIPAKVRERARLHLLDTVGCGLAAVAVDAAGAATTIALEQGGSAEASVLGAATRVAAAPAALANGTRCHALDFDDTHERGICHSSTVVAPAALAVGEACDSSGEEVLAAYALGTEVALRIAVAAADGLYARGFHPTSVCGAFGATAAAARLLGLDREQTTNALGIVGSFASGLFEYLSDGSSTKPLHAGWAAQAGIQAARLAGAGGTGPSTVIEGPFGLLASHTGTGGDGVAISTDPGDAWELPNLSIKAFPACHFAHSSTWAAGELADRHGLTPDDIREIRVRIPTEGKALVLDPLDVKHSPRTPYDAKFSLPFTVAHRLVHGQLGLAAFSEESIRDPDVLALAGRVRPEALETDAPSRFAGGARIVTASGEEHDLFLDGAPGSPGNPLPEREILAKFRTNAELALEPGAAAELSEALQHLDDLPTLERPMALARAASRLPA